MKFDEPSLFCIMFKGDTLKYCQICYKSSDLSYTYFDHVHVCFFLCVKVMNEISFVHYLITINLTYLSFEWSGFVGHSREKLRQVYVQI